MWILWIQITIIIQREKLTVIRRIVVAASATSAAWHASNWWLACRSLSNALPKQRLYFRNICGVAMVYDGSSFATKSLLRKFSAKRPRLQKKLQQNTSCNFFFATKQSLQKKICNKTYVTEIILQQDLCCSFGGALGSLDLANRTAREPASF